MPEEKIKNTKKTELTPPLGSIGEAGGTMMPTTAGQLVWNPDSIPLKTYIEMEDDAQIKAVLTLIKAPLIKVVWSITCEDADIAKFCRDVLNPLWGQLLRQMTNALNFGHQGFEKVWEKEGNSWIIKEFLDLYPDSVSYRKDENKRFDGIQQRTTKGLVDIPKEKSFVFTNEKRFGNPYGRSKLRSAYSYWFMDKYTYDFENIYFERFASPIIIGEAPPGKTQTGDNSTQTTDNLVGLKNKIEALRNSSALVIPSEVDPVTKEKKWKVGFLEAQRRGADYRHRHEYLDLMKARAIFAPELVFSAPYAGSSYALAREHSTIFMNAEEAILQEVKLHIDKYILQPLVLYNFGKDAPEATWDFESIDPRVRTLLTDLVMAMVAGDIIRPDANWIARTLGVKLREDAGKEKEKEIKGMTQDMILQSLKNKGAMPPSQPAGPVEVSSLPKEDETVEPGLDTYQPAPPSALPPSDKVSGMKEMLKQAIMSKMGKQQPIPGPTLAPQAQLPPGPVPEEIIPGDAQGLPPEILERLQGKKKKKSKRSAALRRWATTPSSKRFQSGRARERAFAKGLFEDTQNYWILGVKKRYRFSEEQKAYINIKLEENNKSILERIAGVLYGFYRRKK